MNKRFLSKFYKSMIIQHPPEVLYSAINALDNKYKANVKTERTCLLNNSDCSNQSKRTVAPNKAANSHSIPKKNLKYLSTNKRVHILKEDNKNPFKRTLDKSSIKSTLTFQGFCSYHDNEIFKEIENDDNIEYNNHNVFLIAYRALAKNYIELKEIIERLEWDISTWNCEERQEVRKQSIIFEMESRLIYGYDNWNSLKQVRNFWGILKLFIQFKYLYKLKVKSDIRFFKNQLKLNNIKLDFFNTLIKTTSNFDLHYRVHHNLKSIGFSYVLNYKIQSNEVFIYLTSLPQNEGSDLVVSCSCEDYLSIKSDMYANNIFQGDEKTINRVLNIIKDKIVHNIEGQDDHFSIPYFQEWEHPLIQIEYFKLKSS